MGLKEKQVPHMTCISARPISYSDDTLSIVKGLAKIFGS